MFDQAINSEGVRREQMDGTEYAVAPVTLLKPMHLNVPGNWNVNEAYLPEEEAKASIPSWNGTPLTLNHPTQNGAGTTANSPEMHEKTVLGRVFNAEWESGAVQGEAWFNIPKIRDMGGMAENALERVLNGDSVEVSTGYRASKLPSGEYDGETRNAVQGNLKPDHLAVLPNQQGKCSVEAGCGVGEPVANSLIVTNAEMITNQRSEARTPEYDGTETQSWGDVSKDLTAWADALDIDASSVGEMTAEEKQTVAAHTLLGDAEADTWQELSYFPVVNPNTGNLNRGALMAVLSGRGAQADIPDDVLESARNVAENLLSEEFDEGDGEGAENSLRRVYNALKGVFGEDSGVNEPAESGADEPTETTLNMSERTQELVDNHGFKADNLPDEDTECFDAIYNRFTEENAEEQDTETEDVENAENVKEITESELDELISNRVDERLAEQQERSEKEELASEIAANTEDYESADEVLEDYPTEAALNTKRDDVLSGQPDFGTSRGASAQPATNSEDADDLKMFGGDA